MSTDRPLRTAEVIAVGSELLGSTRVDTNSLFLSERLASLGIQLRAKAVVGDDRALLAEVFRAAIHRSDVVILTGGLGPTDDDLTRDAVAATLGAPLALDPEIADALRERFRSFGYQDFPQRNLRQAMVPAGARVTVLREGSGPQERSIRIDFSQEREGRSPLPRYAVCQFSGLSRTDLSGLTSDRGPVGGAALYLLKHYYLDTPDAAVAEPGAG